MKENLEPYVGQSYDCQMCGRCCHCRTVPLTRGDIERIGRFNTDKDFLEFHVPLRTPVLARREWDLGCVFLEDGRCTIHQYKPLICRLFPYAIYFEPIDDKGDEGKYCLPDGSVVYIYIDRACPGVSDDIGESPHEWLLPLAQRIRLEMAVTRYYYDGVQIK